MQNLNKTRNGESKREITLTSSIDKFIVFRSLVIFSLLLAAGLCGAFAFIVLSREERNSFDTQYDSLSDQILQSTHNRLLRARTSLDEVVTMHGIHHPNASSWPYAFMQGYDDLHEHISTVGNVIAMAMGPIIQPDEVEEFENYVRSIYLKEPYKSQLPAGVTFDLGVYGRGENGTYHITTGEVSFSKYNFITPILNVGNLSRSGRALMFNFHSEPLRAEAIDACYECSLHTKKACTVMTDIVQLVSVDEPRPDTIMVRAVYPYNNPDKLVGFQVISVSWKDMLTGLLPDYVCGLDAVLSTETHKFTYTLCDGKATAKCSDDCHESRFNSHQNMKVLDLKDIAAIQPHEYHLEVYPTQLLYDSYHSDTPWLSAVAVVVVILFTSLVFICYDQFLAKDSREKQQVLEAKRRFVRFVSHEIRTPLTSLVLGLKLLSDNVEVLPSEIEAKKDLKQMTVELEGCSNVAVMILNDLLQYDKIETGSMKMDTKELPICDLIRANIHLFKSSAEEKQISLVVEEEESMGKQKFVIGDELRLAQVIGNLISNAVKFSVVGSKIDVSISFTNEPLQRNFTPSRSKSTKDQELGWIVFSVKDTGPGISSENLDKLFGEGVQFNPNELQGGQGSGLGLWISKGIIELHGGHIWATSEGEGRGCSFYFELPIASVMEDKDRFLSATDEILVDIEASINVPSKIVSVIPPSSMSVVLTARDSTETECKEEEEEEEVNKVLLIVDDVPMLRKMLNRSLKAKGYECVEAEDGRECVNMIKEGLSVACILMDFQMPFMTGPEATRELRKLGFNLPIVGVTGNVMPEDVAEFVSAGVDKVMGKPFQMEVFEDFMKKISGLKLKKQKNKQF